MAKIGETSKPLSATNQGVTTSPNSAQATRVTVSVVGASGNPKLDEAKAIIRDKNSTTAQLRHADSLLAKVEQSQMKLPPEKRTDLAAALNMRGIIETRVGTELDGRLLMQRANDVHKALTGSNMERAQYNLASSLAREGDLANAKLYLAEAFRLKPELREAALKDPDFKAIVDMPAVPGLYTPRK